MVKQMFKTQFTVSIGSDSDLLVANLDTRPDGQNKGRKEFYPGDTIYFIVYKSQRIKYLAMKSNIGTPQACLLTAETTEKQSFVIDSMNADSYDLSFSKPVKEMTDVEWTPYFDGMGLLSKFSYKLESDIAGRITGIKTITQKDFLKHSLSKGRKGKDRNIALLDMTYNSCGDLWKIEAPSKVMKRNTVQVVDRGAFYDGDTDYTIHIAIIGLTQQEHDLLQKEMNQPL